MKKKSRLGVFALCMALSISQLSLSAPLPAAAKEVQEDSKEEAEPVVDGTSTENQTGALQEAKQTEEELEEGTKASEVQTEEPEAADEAAVLAEARAADINAPIIEAVTLDVRDQTLTSLDTPVNITVKASDMEGQISRIEVWLEARNHGENWQPIENMSVWDIGKNAVEQTLTYDLNKGCGTECAISGIKVVDDSGNVSYFDVGNGWSETGYQYRFYVDPDAVQQKIPELESMEIETKEVAQNDNLTVKAVLNKPYEYRNVTMTIQNIEGGRFLDIPTGSSTMDSQNIMLTGYLSSSEVIKGKWKITKLTMQDIWLNTVTIAEDKLPGTAEDRTFTVTERTGGTEGEDLSEFIKDPTFEVTAKDGKVKEWKSGMLLEEGDTITAEVGMKEGYSSQLTNKDLGDIDFEHPLGTAIESYFDISLKYNEAKAIFEGSRTVSEQDYPSEWSLGRINIWNGRNSTKYYTENTPYYFYVSKDGTLARPSYDIVVQVQYLDENGNYVYDSEIKLEKVARRSKLQSLLADSLSGFPGYKECAIIGWETWDGIALADLVAMGSNYITLRPVYDKTISKVHYSYVNQNGVKVGDNYERIDENGTMTCQQLIDRIKTDLKEKAEADIPEGLTLIDFTLKDQNLQLEEKLDGSVLSLNFEPEYDQRVISIRFGYVDENGKLNRDAAKSVFVSNEATYQEILDANIPFLDNPYAELPFERWMLTKWGTEIPDLSKVPQDMVEELYCEAVYTNKSIVEIKPRYYAEGDTENKYYTQEEILLILEKGGTYQSVLDRLNTLKHMEGMKVKEWSGIPNLEQIVPNGISYMSAGASYENIAVTIYCSGYYGKDGNNKFTSLFMAVNPGETYGDLSKRISVEHYEGLELEEWKPNDAEADDVVVADKAVSFYPNYKNCLLSYYMNVNTVVVYDKKVVAEKGETVTMPVLSDYKEMKWNVIKLLTPSVPQYLEPGATLTVDGFYIINGILNSNIPKPSPGDPEVPKPSPEEPEVPEEPEEPEEPEDVKVTGVSLNQELLSLTKEGEQFQLKAVIKPDNAVNKEVTWKSSNTKVATVENGIVSAVFNGEADITAVTVDGGFKASCKVTVNIPPKEIPEDKKEEVKDQIQNAAQGERVTINMEGATVIPKDILETAKENNVDVVLDMGEYTWTIKSGSISDNLSNINLEVRKVTNVIPDDVIGSLVGDNHYQEISLTHNGDFGFQAELKLKVEPEDKGKYGNLYYHDSSGKMVFMNTGIIGEDGSVNLDFSHASDYLLVISETPAAEIVTVTGVKLDRDQIQFKAAGETATLTASVEPADASDTQVTWTSSNEAVATVVNGVVTAAANGSTVITVTTNDGGFTAQCAVLVAIPDADNPGSTETPDPNQPGTGGTDQNIENPQGGSQTANETVAAAPKEVPGSPKTGDSSQLAVLVSLMCLAFAAMGMSIKVRKQK